MKGLSQLAASVPIRTASTGTQIAIPLLAVDTTGDVGLGAALVAVALLPSIVAAPLVGALLDRAKHPRALMMAAAAGVAAAYAIASALGALPVWAVVVALLISGLLNPFGFGGFSSFVATPGSDARRAYAIDALSYNVSGVAGPAVVAALAPALGPRAALMTMAAVALISLGTYPLLPMQARTASGKGMFHSMTVGIIAMTARRRLAVVTVSGTLTEFGRGIMPIAAIGIALATTSDASASAVIVASFAVGALLGATIVALRRPSLSPQARMSIGYLLTGLATLAAALGFGFGWVVALIGLSGFFTAAPNAAMLLLRRTESPDEVVAQVFTVSAALRVAASAGGTALAGALSGVDPLVLLAGSGAVWLVGAAVMLAFPRRR